MATSIRQVASVLKDVVDEDLNADQRDNFLSSKNASAPGKIAGKNAYIRSCFGGKRARDTKSSDFDNSFLRRLLIVPGFFAAILFITFSLWTRLAANDCQPGMGNGFADTSVLRSRRIHRSADSLGRGRANGSSGYYSDASVSNSGKKGSKSMQNTKTSCRLGLGFWEIDSTWKIFDEKCTLPHFASMINDYTTANTAKVAAEEKLSAPINIKTLEQTARSAPEMSLLLETLQNKNILFIGDSLTRYVVESMCAYWVGAQLTTLDCSTCNRDWGQVQMNVCRLPALNMTLSTIFLFGFSAENTLSFDIYKGVSPVNFIQRTEEFSALYRQKVSAGGPNLLSIHSLQWDLAIRYNQTSDFREKDKDVSWYDGRAIKDWIDNAKILYSTLEALMPDADKVWLTIAPTAPSKFNNWGPQNTPGHREAGLHAMINNAARHVANEVGVPVLDWESMVRSLYFSERFTKDGLHYSGPPAIELVNILLGLLLPEK